MGLGVVLLILVLVIVAFICGIMVGSDYTNRRNS